VLAESHPVPALAERIIREGMGLLSRRQYAELARQLRAPLLKVQEAAHFISENLNPFPGRASWGENRQATAKTNRVYYQPDIIINRSNDSPDGPLVVEIIMPLYGTLRVNPLYKQAVQEATTDEQKDGLRTDLERASLFIKCLQQRNNTIQRLIQCVVIMQREFILRGEKHLIPVTRAQIAHDLEVHESTVSRAVANKAVQMPNGRIIPLAGFFDRSLNVRTILRELIADEPYPLSDAELADQLASRGINIARRTVAKYRSMEGILPANMRH
jgi:RNA polymerase sigma-54 factor